MIIDPILDAINGKEPKFVLPEDFHFRFFVMVTLMSVWQMVPQKTREWFKPYFDAGAEFHACKRMYGAILKPALENGPVMYSIKKWLLIFAVQIINEAGPSFVAHTIYGFIVNTIFGYYDPRI